MDDRYISFLSMIHGKSASLTLFTGGSSLMAEAGVGRLTSHRVLWYFYLIRRSPLKFLFLW